MKKKFYRVYLDGPGAASDAELFYLSEKKARTKRFQWELDLVLEKDTLHEVHMETKQLEG